MKKEQIEKNTPIQKKELKNTCQEDNLTTLEKVD